MIELAAWEDFLAEQRKQLPHQSVSRPGKQLVTGEEASKIADTPYLTGDPEWDAIEMAETAEVTRD